jgi:thiol:disulfide interchange protein DsbD
MRTTRFLVSLVLLFVIAAASQPRAQRPADIVRWSATTAGADVKPGDLFRIDLTAQVQEGWHLYALTQPKGGPNPLAIAVRKGNAFEIRSKMIVAPAPQVVKDPNFDLETHQYDGKVTFQVPVAAPRTVPAGAQTVPIEVTFQACGNGICLRPFTQAVPVTVTIAAPSAAR